MFCSLLCAIICTARVRSTSTRTSLDDFALQQRQSEMKITSLTKHFRLPATCHAAAPQLVRLARSKKNSHYHLRVPFLATWTANLMLSPSALLREYFFTARIVCIYFSLSRVSLQISGLFYATFFWSCGISVIIPQLPAYFTPPFLVDLSKSKLRVTLHDLFHASRLLLAFTSTSSCSLA
jgi:hypothetical protein